MKRKIRIAWFTGGLRDANVLKDDSILMSDRFSELMLPFVSSACDVEVFTDSFESFRDYQTFHYLSAYIRHSRSPYDIFLYQVENGSQSHFMRSALGLHPGITVFHDFLMTDFGSDPLTNSPWSSVVSKFRSSQIAWPDRLEEHPRTSPIAERESGLTFVPMFTSVRAHGEFKRQIVDTIGGEKSWYIPIPVADRGILPPTIQKKELCVGFCGSPRIEHRAHKLLQALHSAKIPLKLLWLVDTQEVRQARELAKEFQFENVEIIEGRSPAAWDRALPQIDVAVHTLFSVFGSTGFFLPQSLMASRCCIVTRFADTDTIPGGIVWKIDSGENESAQIVQVLQEISKHKELLNNRGGREFAKENYEVSLVAKEFLLAIESSLSLIQEKSRKWENLLKDAHEVLLTEQRVAHHPWGVESLNKEFHELGWC